MDLTPELLAHAYSLLRQTKPFNRWALPPVEDVEFHVTRHKDRYGDCRGAEPYRIRISENFHGNIVSLLASMGHEMCHIRQKTYPTEREHGPVFKRLAKSVCKYHPFDQKVF